MAKKVVTGLFRVRAELELVRKNGPFRDWRMRLIIEKQNWDEEVLMKDQVVERSVFWPDEACEETINACKAKIEEVKLLVAQKIEERLETEGPVFHKAFYYHSSGGVSCRESGIPLPKPMKKDW